MEIIFTKCLYIEEGKGDIERARQILMDEFGLVPPEGPLRTEKEVVVWEDEKGIGRYRVHFSPHTRFKGNYYDAMRFAYWTNRRANREIFEQDPMKPALEKVLKSIEGAVHDFPEMDFIMDIDEALDLIFNKQLIKGKWVDR